MKKRSLFICGLFLLNSPTLSMEDFIDKAINFALARLFPSTDQENEKKIGEELEDIPVSPKEKTIHQFKSEVGDTKIKRELVSPMDSSGNRNKKAHFVGDAYGWIIVYY